MIVTYFFPPVSLEYNCHTALYKFKVNSIYCEMIATIRLLNIHTSYTYKKEKNCFFFMMRTFRVYSLSSFQIHYRAVSTAATVLHTTSPKLTYLTTGDVITFLLSPPHPGNHKFNLFFIMSLKKFRI